MTLYLSQLRLSRSPSVHALEYLFRGNEEGQRRSAQHNLLWSAFSETPDQKRDFLWRAESDGSFLTLSPRPPREDNELFARPRFKLFAPELKAGDRLSFKLQVNATKMKRDTRKRVDVVMDALHSVPRGERAKQRMALASEAGAAWLAGQGEKAGFVPLTREVEKDGRLVEEYMVDADDYHVETLPRFDTRRHDRPQLGILDLSGILEVTEPAAFLAQLGKGFGRAKAFGCGLMLIRRAL